MEVVRALDRFVGFAATDSIIEGEKKCKTTKNDEGEHLRTRGRGSNAM